jgi:hypothetical protein
MKRAMDLRSGPLVLALSTVMLPLGAALPSFAANIITFGDGANSCGGAVICSYDGTTGYLNNGKGQAFDLSTINSWFQIDLDGMNHLSTQTMAEPDKGAGGFRVLNDTGSAVTTFSLTITDTYTSSTGCKITGKNCNSFQASKPNGTYSPTSEALSGPDFYLCTGGKAFGGYPCYSTAGNASAEFSTPGPVTYTWNLDIPKGDYFDISFASWSSSAYTTPTTAPEASALTLTGLVLLAFGAAAVRARRRELA